VTGISSAGLGPEINMGYIEGFIASNSRKDIKPHLETLFADPSLVTRDLVNDILKFKRLDGVEASLRSIAGAVFPGGKQGAVLRDRLGGLKPPAQVIFGSKDRVIPPDHAKGLPASIQVHTLPDAGHMGHMEAAGEVNRLIAKIAG
jgi:pyruvate dehydrogenase E2 component (dihydrolipoamide acetyltransferase)